MLIALIQLVPTRVNVWKVLLGMARIVKVGKPNSSIGNINFPNQINLFKKQIKQYIFDKRIFQYSSTCLITLFAQMTPIEIFDETF